MQSNRSHANHIGPFYLFILEVIEVKFFGFSFVSSTLSAHVKGNVDAFPVSMLLTRAGKTFWQVAKGFCDLTERPEQQQMDEIYDMYKTRALMSTESEQKQS